MPTPVAHGLIGLALGFARFLPDGLNWRGLARRAWAQRGWLLVCVVLACAPDADYFFGILRGNLNIYHQTITHTLGWIALVSLAVGSFAWARRYDRSAWGFLFILALTGSHLIADYFCADTSFPRGIMIAWPFSDRYWTSPVSLFPGPAKKTLTDLWTLRNIGVVAVELLITLPLVAAVLVWKRWRGSCAEPLILNGGRSSRDAVRGEKDGLAELTPPPDC